MNGLIELQKNIKMKLKMKKDDETEGPESIITQDLGF